MDNIEREWHSRETITITQEQDSKFNHLPMIIKVLCEKRNIVSSMDYNLFFSPSLASLYSPFLMKGIKQGAALLSDAIYTKKRPVIIYGDYDVDGITGTALLFSFLKELGCEVYYCHPDRFKHGYGLNRELINELSEQHEKALLITVDCGITDHESIKFGKKSGLTIIITDHHQPPGLLPEADVIINPLQTGCDFPFKQLAGVGVSFYLAMGLRSYLVEQGVCKKNEVPNLKKYLDFVALGTIADMVPLSSINRILVKAGLQVLSHTENKGLIALLEKAGLVAVKPVDETDIGFKLGPRINAAGRMGDPERALKLLIADNSTDANLLANALDKENSLRRMVSEQVFQEAIVQAQEKIENEKITLVVYDSDWHPGVIGIVASRLVEKFNRPAIVFSGIKNSQAKGSGRTAGQLNLYNVLSNCKKLDSFGGHKAAAGITVDLKKLSFFADEFEKLVAEQFVLTDFLPKLYYDTVVELSEIFNPDFLNYLKIMGPYGIGNEEPVFITKNAVLLETPKKVGLNHLSFSCKVGNCKIKGIGFGLSSYLQLVKDEKVVLAFNLRENWFRNKSSWQLNLIDIKKHPL
jgi:single-stranded-DNA-specific exonuclease